MRVFLVRHGMKCSRRKMNKTCPELQGTDREWMKGWEAREARIAAWAVYIYQLGKHPPSLWRNIQSFVGKYELETRG